MELAIRSSASAWALIIRCSAVCVIASPLCLPSSVARGLARGGIGRVRAPGMARIVQCRRPRPLSEFGGRRLSRPPGVAPELMMPMARSGGPEWRNGCGGVPVDLVPATYTCPDDHSDLSPLVLQALGGPGLAVARVSLRAWFGARPRPSRSR